MLFRSYRKRKALDSYQQVLGSRLRGVYGQRDYYAPHEVLSTLATYQLSTTFTCYALAMYCDRESFDAHHAEHGDVACSYYRLSNELSGHVTFNAGTASWQEHETSDPEGIVDVAEALDNASHPSGYFSHALGDAGIFDAIDIGGGGFDGGGGD